MKLRKITLTGADDSIDPRDLVELAAKYPFSEWGVLFIHKSQGHGRGLGDGSRFPSFDWIKRLLEIAPPSMNLCAHLCGSIFVNNLVEHGSFAFGRIPGIPSERFQRIQLNFHAQPIDPFSRHIQLNLTSTGREFLFQCDGVNDPIIKEWVQQGCGFPLFDTSGGAGLTPSQLEGEWPKVWPGVYCGYAGGLGPTNVVDETLGPIAQAAGDSPIWIDMETRVRSHKDSLFDLAKCEEVLKAMEPHVET